MVNKDRGYSTRVTVVIPCRNEKKNIENLIKDIEKQTYPAELTEVFVVDGLSDDGTWEILKDLSNRRPWLRLIRNEKRYVPFALNSAIKSMNGDVLIILGAHSRVPHDYIESLIKNLYKLKADNVGGVLITKPGSDSRMARAIARVLSHPLGVGDSRFRIGIDKRPKEVDTVPFGCYPKRVFEKIGLFDERLIRNQDFEFNSRLKRAGGRIFLIPSIKLEYIARDSLIKFIKNAFDNGRWVLLTLYYSRKLRSVSLRHAVPAFFVLYLCTLPVSLIIFAWIAPIILYLILVILSSFKIAYKERDILLFPYLVTSFLSLHISYGIGTFFALFELAKDKLSKIKRARDKP